MIIGIPIVNLKNRSNRAAPGGVTNVGGIVLGIGMILLVFVLGGRMGQDLTRIPTQISLQVTRIHGKQIRS